MQKENDQLSGCQLPETNTTAGQLWHKQSSSQEVYNQVKLACLKGPQARGHFDPLSVGAMVINFDAHRGPRG